MVFDDGTIKMITSIVGIVIAILGLPVTFAQAKKTSTEARKLEVEILEIRSRLPENKKRISEGESFERERLSLNFRLLVVALDLVIYFVALTVISYFFSALLWFNPSLKNLLMAIVALPLLPILIEFLRIKHNLQRAQGTSSSTSTRPVKTGRKG